MKLFIMNTTQIIHIVAVFICTVQLCHITQTYFAFSVITKVLIKAPENVILPAFTMCEFMAHLFDGEVLKGEQIEVHGTPLELLSEDEQRKYFTTVEWAIKSEEFLSKKSHAELQKIMEKRRSSVDVWFVTDPRTGNRRFHPQSDFIIRNSFVEKLVCRTISPRDPKSFEYTSNSLRQASFSGLMANFRVHRRSEFLTSLHVSLSPPGQLPRDTAASFSTVDLVTGNKGNVLVYKQMEVKRLSLPYSTDCFNYDQWGFESREHAYQDCLNENAVKHWNSTSKGTTVEWNSKFERYFAGMTRTEFGSEQWRRTIAECSQKTERPDCHEIHYVVTDIRSLSLAENVSYFVVTVPYEPTILTTFHPEMTFNDFIVAFGSTLGYWLGFNIVAACIYCTTIFKKIYKAVRIKFERVRMNAFKF